MKKLSGEHEEVIRALLDAGADPMVGHLSALWYSASYRNVRAMQLFLRPGTWPREAEQKPKLDDYADGGWSLLHEVVASKASGMARFFMKVCMGRPVSVRACEWARVITDVSSCILFEVGWPIKKI